MNDFNTITTANGDVVPDHKIIVNNGTLHEKVDCVPLDDLSLRLLSVGRRCKAHGCRFCWEPYAAEPRLQNPMGEFIPVECDDESNVPHIFSSSSCSKKDDDELLRCVPCMTATALDAADIDAQAQDDDKF